MKIKNTTDQQVFIDDLGLLLLPLEERDIDEAFYQELSISKDVKSLLLDKTLVFLNQDQIVTDGQVDQNLGINDSVTQGVYSTISMPTETLPGMQYIVEEALAINPGTLLTIHPGAIVIIG